MAGINLTVHLEYDEVVERIKSEGWVIPVRCRECKHSIKGISGMMHCKFDMRVRRADWFCADGERKGGDE